VLRYIDFRDHGLTLFDDATLLLLDLYGSLYCGDISEVRQLLDQDFAAVNQVSLNPSKDA